MEWLYPFHIITKPVGAGNAGAVKVNGPSATINGKLELHVVTGGPVYLFRGRRETVDIFTMLSDLTGQVDFDLAANAASCHSDVEVQGGLETVTVYSEADSIGYIKVTIPDGKTQVDKFEELLTEVRKGVSIARDTHVNRIPLAPTEPQVRSISNAQDIRARY